MSRQARRHGVIDSRRCVVTTALGRAVAVLVMLAALGNWPARAADQTTAGLAFRVGKVVAMDDQNTVVNDAVVLVKDGRIEAVGPTAKIAIPTSYRVLDFKDAWLVPGLVDAHDHAAAGTWSDLNDMVYLSNPGLDSRAGARPDNEWIKRARAGGVTTVMLLPGSGTNISGFGTVVNTGGKSPDGIIIRSPGSLKIAQAGNPEWYFGGNGRMFMNWNTRQTLEKARAYAAKWAAYDDAAKRSVAAHDKASKGGGDEHATAPSSAPGRPEFDPIWDGFRGLFNGTYPATVHTQIYQVVLTTIDMIDGHFKLWTVLDHSCFDAWKLGPLVSAAESAGDNIWTICGPRGYHFDRNARRMVGFAAGWWKNGVRRVGINTDAPVIPQEELFYQAAMACYFGWLPYDALRGVTNIPAKAIGVYNQVGSVEPHKQADLTIWTGDPLDPRSACLMTVVDGKIVYDGTKSLRRF